MIFPLLAIAMFQAAGPAAQPPEAQPPEVMHRECLALVASDAARAAEVAEQWRVAGGGTLARQCLGLAFVALERWQPAAVTFEQAAREAESKQDPLRVHLWVQSGNAWLAANDGAKARTAFDAALATNLLSPALRGEVHLDRARAGVALEELGPARADLDKGLELVPSDPFGWYLSAALAMRQKDMARAQRDIAKAVELAPDDANVLLQAGTIAGAAGNFEGARRYYEAAVKAAPESEAGRGAQAALASEPAATPPAP